MLAVLYARWSNQCGITRDIPIPLFLQSIHRKLAPHDAEVVWLLPDLHDCACWFGNCEDTSQTSSWPLVKHLDVKKTQWIGLFFLSKSYVICKQTTTNLSWTTRTMCFSQCLVLYFSPMESRSNCSHGENQDMPNTHALLLMPTHMFKPKYPVSWWPTFVDRTKKQLF